MTVPHWTRKAALDLLRRGLLAHSEAAELVGVTRQAVAQWCAAAGIDPTAARSLHLAQLFARAVAAYDERPEPPGQRPGPKPKPKPRGRPTKRPHRRRA